MRAWLDDFIISIREGDADRPLLGRLIGSQAGGGNTFREAVALTDLDHRAVVHQELVKALLQLHRQGVAPENTPLRQLRSAFFMAGRRSRASYKVGTPAMKLQRYFSSSLA